MKPIIGIVGRADKEEEGYNVICCFEAVRRSIVKKGGVPILILPNQDLDYELVEPKNVPSLNDSNKKDLEKVIDMCDGIVIPGTFKIYEYDKYIYEYSKEKDKPILCICGGMQLMALMDNNILVKNEINHFKKGEKYVHKVKVEKYTLLYKILNKEEINVNSRHNYHVDKVNNLIISAYSSDGLIEALEDSNKKFVLGVQWHPEAMIEYDEDANKIIEEFIKSCKH